MKQERISSKNTKARHAQKDFSEALEQFQRKRASLTGCVCRLPSLPGNYLRILFYLKTLRSEYFIQTASKTK